MQSQAVKFLIKFTILTIPIGLLCLFIEIGLVKVRNSYNVKVGDIEVLNDSIEVLVLGSSHGYFGINPTYLTPFSYNFSNTSQSLYYDCQLLKKYCQKMPNLRLLILPISYFSLETTIEGSKEDWRKYYYTQFMGIKPERSTSLFDIKGSSLIALYQPGTAFSYMLRGFNVDLASHVQKNGWYRLSDDEMYTVTEDGAKSRIEIHHKQMKVENVKFNSDQLNETIAFARKKGIRLLFVTIPVSQKYFERLDPEKYSRMLDVLEQLCSKNNIKHLNYISDKRFDLSDFSDPDHLSPKGAEKLTKILDIAICNELKN
ncbi:MAG: hypothetical protein IT235_06740 [Bacteroidia bacterium]|nr:hypothetical protein [Bacteroidia bacterium]